MIARCIVALLLVLGCTQVRAQDLPFREIAASNDAELARAVPALAKQVLAVYREDKHEIFLDNLFRLQLAAGHYAESVASMAQWRALSSEPASSSIGLRLYARARAFETAERVSFEEAWQKVFRESLAAQDDRTAYDTTWSLATAPANYRQRMQPLLDRRKGKSTIALEDAIALIRAWIYYESYRTFAPLLAPLVAQDEERRYIIEDDVLIRTKHGATLSATIVRSRHAAKQPTALMTVFQTNPVGMRERAKFAASRGYVGMGSDTRGKRLSPDDIVLFEHDAEDLYGVIDWISRQSWSDGQVGMYGGSNAGFTQWAAAKSLHPALRTIVPYCPLDPGFGLPMYNNVFITANYDVHFMLGNSKYTDEKFAAPGRYDAMLEEWYRSGRPYREIDRVDGHPNKYLQRYLQHPAYDDFWQSLTANGNDYKKLDIPVLAIDGYYDDGQNNAVRRLQEHYHYRPDAEHYLVIGPYDHLGAQFSWKAPILRGYQIDPVAQLDTPELTFQWFDYVLKGGPKPTILEDRINYQVMGSNVWRHAPSIEAMSSEKLTLFFTSARSGEYYQLARTQPTTPGGIKQIVDFSDRVTRSADTYPSPIVSSSLDLQNALAFISEPFDAPVSVNGLFSAEMRSIVNKKDMDVAMVLYEVTPRGEFFHLSYTVQRASYARDMTQRRLLRPHKVETIPLDNTLLVSRQLGKGSRLLVVLDINRGPHAQVNYGSGKDVSDESIADATEPLVVEWLNDSTITIPISR